MEEPECSATRDMSVTSDLVPLEYFIPLATVSKGVEQKMIVVNR